MNIVHIGFTDSGGAGKGMVYLHQALKKAGIDSHVLVAEKSSYDEDIVCAEKTINLYSYSKNRLIRFIQKAIKKRGGCLNRIDKYKRKVMRIPSSDSCFFTFPITHYDILQHPLVKDADIIHLHWIANFVDFPSFFRNIDKSIVWTLRDENPGLGGFHYESARDKYGKYYASIENDFLDIKRTSLSSCNNLTIIAMSDAMKVFCAKNDLLRSFPVKRIDNLVDLSLYNPIPQESAKTCLGLNRKAYSIVFVSVTLGDPRKNLGIVYEALSLIPFATELVCVGRNDYFKTIPDNVICLNSVESERLMSVVYSAADVFVTPSIQESFGKTTVEALACGSPVVSSDVGIASEVITPDNGILLDEISAEAVAQAIIKSHDVEYDRESIRRKALARFDSGRIVKEYMDLYDELIP